MKTRLYLILLLSGGLAYSSPPKGPDLVVNHLMEAEP